MIVLFTDFGLTGPYTGQVKAVLARLAPGVPVIDLMADAPACQPQPAAYLLAAHLDLFGPDDVVVAVVDPGVGSARAPLLVEADGLRLVGPDNGLLVPTLQRARDPRAWTIGGRPQRLSDTFHGRDLFAPVAARLAGGDGLAANPSPRALESLVGWDWPEDLAAVCYLDPYGNATTGVRAATLPAAATLEVAGRRLPRGRTFSDVPPGSPLWYANSSGLVEIALNGGRADHALGLSIGTPVTIF